MKYSPETYAAAFVAAWNDATPTEREEMDKRFIETLRRNNDFLRAEKILEAVERCAVCERGGNMVLIEFARPQEASHIKKLSSSFRKTDVIASRINSGLIAGVRVTIDGEQELDNSLERKLRHLFDTHAV